MKSLEAKWHNVCKLVSNGFRKNHMFTYLNRGNSDKILISDSRYLIYGCLSFGDVSIY